MSDPVSICFVSPKAYGLFDPAAASNYGGAEVDLYMLAVELAKDPGFRVSFVTADYGQPPEQTIDNVRLLKSLSFREPPFAGAWKIWRALKRADAQFYMIKTISPGVPLTWAFCRLHRRRFLYRTASARECDGACRSDQPLTAKLFYRCLRHADGVFAQNRQDAARLRERFSIPAVVIPNGHRLQDSPPAEKQTVLWVGRSAEVKHPERFFELARAFPREPFVMVCRRATGDANYDRLRQQAAAVENLEFHENVDFARIGDCFARARVFVNTSDSEGFANTFIQAAAAGTCILTWSVNPDNFLTEYQCGLACQANAEKLNQGLSFLLEDNRCLDLGQNGRRYVREHHDITAIAEQYKTYLRQRNGG